MSNLDELEQILAKERDRRILIERALIPSQAIADVIKAFQPPAYLSCIENLTQKALSQRNSISAIEINKSIQPPTYLTALSQTMAVIQREQQIFKEFHQPNVIGDLTKQIVQMRNLGESITAPLRNFREMIQVMGGNYSAEPFIYYSDVVFGI